MAIELGKLMYTGKVKDVYYSENDDEVIIKFRDDITAGDGAKKDNLHRKGYFNSIITSKIFEILEDNGIKTQYIELLEPMYLRTKKLEMIPLEVIARNLAAGSLLKNFPFEKNQEFKPALIQLDYKNDEFHDPMLNDDIAVALNLASYEEIKEIKEITQKLNTVLKNFFAEKGVILVDFKIEFGRDSEGNIILGDEISPDSCRLWDAETLEVLDKDLFRQGKGGVMDAYEKIANLILTEDDKKRFKM